MSLPDHIASEELRRQARELARRIAPVVYACPGPLCATLALIALLEALWEQEVFRPEAQTFPGFLRGFADAWEGKRKIHVHSGKKEDLS